MKFKTKGHADKAHYFIDGYEVEKAIYDLRMQEVIDSLPKAAPDADLPGSRPWSRPIESVALQVHPRQIEAARERNAKHGLNIEYRPDGKPVLHDRAERRALLRVEKMHDNDGGYSD